MSTNQLGLLRERHLLSPFLTQFSAAHKVLSALQTPQTNSSPIFGHLPFDCLLRHTKGNACWRRNPFGT